MIVILCSGFINVELVRIFFFQVSAGKPTIHPRQHRLRLVQSIKLRRASVRVGDNVVAGNDVEVGRQHAPAGGQRQGMICFEQVADGVGFPAQLRDRNNPGKAADLNRGLRYPNYASCREAGQQSRAIGLAGADASVAPHDENECEAGCEHAPIAVPQRALPHRKGITLLIERSGLGRRTALGCGLPSATLRRAGAPTLPGAPPIRSLLSRQSSCLSS